MLEPDRPPPSRAPEAAPPPLTAAAAAVTTAATTGANNTAPIADAPGRIADGCGGGGVHATPIPNPCVMVGVDTRRH